MATADSTVTYKDISGFPGYRVGDDGSVWSCQTFGPGTQLGSAWRQLRPGRVYGGYRQAHLCVGGQRRVVKVHRLVLLVFAGPPPSPAHEAAHENGDCEDNRLENLSWKTPKENDSDKDRHGTRQVGERNGYAKLTAAQVRQIRATVAAGATHQATAERYGIGRKTVADIVRRLTWKHVT